MHGHGYASPPARRPATATLVTLRVVFVAISLAGLGLFSWAALLRLAIVRGRRLDWVLFGLALAAAIGILVVFGEVQDPDAPAKPEEPGTTPAGVAGSLAMVAMAIGVSVHYLVADIRHYQRPGPQPPAGPSPYSVTVPVAGPPVPPGPPAPGYGYPPARPGAAAYGYPPPAHPPVPPPARSPYTAPPRPPSPYTAQAQPQPQPQSQPPQPSPYTAPAPAPGAPRIEQVRAELDELSDYLRKEQGR
ncbi:hypothetical protein [Streptomyces sp. NPDC020141]|uniref:hypothetical protein n=1 Tax=Streptomyces sp. NPDC020141 TaxID=3365065 RepID=UPI0037AC0737